MKRKFIPQGRAKPYLLHKLISIRKRNEQVSKELLEAIRSCKSEQELTELLYDTCLNTEAEVDAFDKRYQELESGC